MEVTLLGILTEDKEVQEENAYSPMEVTLVPIVNEDKKVQEEKE